MRRGRILALCLLMIGLSLNLARGADTPHPPHSITPADYFKLATISEIALRPDGRRVIFGENRWQTSTDDRKADLWIVDTDGKNPAQRLTFDRANYRHLQWDATGQFVYFLGHRRRGGETKAPYDGTTQVWRLRPDSPDATVQPVTRVDGGISAFSLATEANQLYYSADTKRTDTDAFSSLRQQFDKLDYGHSRRTTSEIHKLDLRTWRTEPVVSGDRYVREFAVNPQGTRIAMLSAVDDTVIRSEGESRLDIWEKGTIVTPPTASYRAKAASPHAWLKHLAWSPNGTHVAFNAIFDAYPAELVIIHSTAAGWNVGLAKRPAGFHVRGYGTPLKWTRENALIAILEKAGFTALVGFDGDSRAVLREPKLRERVIQ
ncbi:MAG: hypothetical protein ACRCZF_14945, partial [Gemmataceae bacterium]